MQKERKLYKETSSKSLRLLFEALIEETKPVCSDDFEFETQVGTKKSLIVVFQTIRFSMEVKKVTFLQIKSPCI